MSVATSHFMVLRQFDEGSELETEALKVAAKNPQSVHLLKAKIPMIPDAPAPIRAPAPPPVNPPRRMRIKDSGHTTTIPISR